jgi:hypothetical protein
MEEVRQSLTSDIDDKNSFENQPNEVKVDSVSDLLIGAVPIAKHNCKDCCGKGYNKSFGPSLKGPLVDLGENYCHCAVIGFEKFKRKTQEQEKKILNNENFEVFKVSNKDGSNGKLVIRYKKEEIKNEKPDEAAVEIQV